jgi:hypothetical protein
MNVTCTTRSKVRGRTERPRKLEECFTHPDNSLFVLQDSKPFANLFPKEQIPANKYDIMYDDNDSEENSLSACWLHVFRLHARSVEAPEQARV